MAIIKNPKSFTEQFGLGPADLDRLGILNPMLNVDTGLFIDPVLLDASTRPEISQRATSSFRQYFGEVITLLRASQTIGDRPWRQARSRFYFREIPYTCLGYGASGIRGSAFGFNLATRLTNTAKEIVDLGVSNPDLFKLLPLLEEGVGPDLISDMTTNVVLKDLFRLTESICKELSVRTEALTYKGEEYQLPRNVTQDRPTPIVLVPKDILRTLPIATDWSEVAYVVSENTELRRRVNELIGEVWKLKTRRQQKEQIRSKLLASREAFEALLDVINSANIQPYDLDRDPKGVVAWHRAHEIIAREYPLALTLTGPPSSDAAIALVKMIIEQFRILVEERGLWKVLWSDDRPRNEKNSQMIFYAIADAYCKANNLDVTPEAETGAGPVDFKFSSGYAIRVIVEIKHSSNSKLISGYANQLETYRTAVSPVCAFYLIVDVGGLGRRAERLVELKNAKPEDHPPMSEIVIVDGRRRPSASRR